jgi:DNA-binding response OmpR family regulator
MRQQHHHRQPTTTVAIVGGGTLSEEILGRLLEREGYHVRNLEAHPTGLVEELLEDVDVLLLCSGLDDGAREGFLEAMRSSQETAAMPVLPLSAALKQALLDELSASASWLSLFEELAEQIRDALARAAQSARALVVEGGGAEPTPPPAAQAADAL